MERATLYQRALAPLMAGAGAIGALAAGLAPYCPAPFVHYWAAVCVAAVALALFLVRRQAIQDREPFWSPPTRRVARAFAPGMMAAAVVTVIFLDLPAGPDELLLLAAFWMMLYGCALHAAGFFALRGIQAVAWLFLIGGAALILARLRASWTTPAALPNWVMGLSFGGFHLGYAAWLYLRRERASTP